MIRNKGWIESLPGRLTLCLLLALFGLDLAGVVSLRGMAIAAEVEILTPRPASTIFARNPSTHLVLRRAAKKAGARQLVVKVGDNFIDPLAVIQDQGKDYLHFRLPLVPGVNNFTILPGGMELEIKYQAIIAAVPPTLKNAYLFHRDEQLPESCVACHELRETRAIEGSVQGAEESCNVCHQDISKAVWQHGPVANKLCLACHQQSVKPWRIGFPPSKIEVICFSCHMGKSALHSRKYLHGPTIVGGCTLCHDPHGGDKRYFLWAEGSLELCITCHSDKENLVKKDDRLPYVHDVIPRRGCVICHDPHASDNLFVLKMPINQLCVSCHSKIADNSQGHPVYRHPVTAPKERRRPGRELSCTSCHDPHGSTHTFMLIEEPLEGVLCRVCHKK